MSQHGAFYAHSLGRGVTTARRTSDACFSVLPSFRTSVRQFYHTIKNVIISEVTITGQLIDRVWTPYVTFLAFLRLLNYHSRGRWMEGILSGRHNNMGLYWESLNSTTWYTLRAVSAVQMLKLMRCVGIQGYMTVSQAATLFVLACDVFNVSERVHRYYRYAPTNRFFKLCWLHLQYYLGLSKEMSLGPIDCPDLASGMAKVLGSAHSADRPSISHPISSAKRNDFLAALSVIATKYKVSPYIVSMSRRTSELGFRGTRFSYHPDLAKLNAPELYVGMNDPVNDDDLLVFVDRDYYFDMTMVLMLGRPIMMYHFWPDEAAQKGGEVRFWFRGDGGLEGRCQGSEDWSHYLWHYPSDKLVVSDGYVQWAYKVYVYRLGPNRRVTLLRPLNWVASCEVVQLQRFNPVMGKTVVISKDGGQDYVSVGAIDSDVAHTIETHVWQGLVSSATARGCDGKLTPVTSQDVRERLSIEYGREVSIARSEAAWLYPALLGMRESFGRPLEPYHPYFTTVTKSGNYQLLSGDHDLGDERAKPSTIEVVRPFTSESSVSPAKDCLGNDYTMYQDRVVTPQNTADKLIGQVSSEDVKYISEFCKLLFPHGPVLLPVDEAFVNEKMSRPSQVADRINCESEVGSGNASSTFTKAESYRKVNAPRMITQVKSMRKWIYARFIYPLSDYLKTFPFYAPGKSPTEVAEIVANLCDYANLHGFAIAKTDYSRFDGTVNAFLRYFCLCVLRAAFGDDIFNNEELEVLASKMYYEKVATNAGALFMGYALGSGMPDTSIIGGSVNIYNAYSYLRILGFSPEEAFARLGLYQGDDGLSIIPHSPQIYEDVVRRHGQLLEIDVVTVGVGYVEFLARVYSPKVWYGSPNSCCDIDRQLSKLTRVTAGNKSRPLFALWAKACGYLATDPNTPIISDICRKIMWLCEPMQYQLPEEILEGRVEKERTDNVSYWALMTFASGSPFPNENEDGWMNHYCDSVVPGLDQQAMLTWLAGLERPNLKLPRVQYEANVMAMLNDRPQFEPCESKAYMGNPSKTVAINVGNDVIIEDGTSPISVEKPDEPVVNHTPKDFAYLDYITRGNPWNLDAGGLKCLALISLFVYDVVCQFNSRKKCIIYTGAKGDTQLVAAKLFSTTRARVIFIDPGFTEDDVKELDPYVVVRRTRMNVKMMQELVADAKKHGNQAIFWIDDAYANSGPDPRAMFNNLKLAVFKAIESDLLGALIKLMDEERVITLPNQQKVTYFRTPAAAPFHEVREVRMLFSPDGKDYGPDAQLSVSQVESGAPSIALFCDYLFRTEELLKDPSNIRKRPVQARGKGGPKGAARQAATASLTPQTG